MDDSNTPNDLPSISKKADTPVRERKSMLDELESNPSEQPSLRSEEVLLNGEKWASIAYLDPSRSKTLFIGLILTGIFYLCIYGAGVIAPDSYIISIFKKPQNLIVVIPACALFFWGIAILILKRVSLNKQRGALRLSIIPQDPGFVLTSETAKHVLTRLGKSLDSPDQFLLLRRIRISISNLNNIGQVSDVSEILRAESDEDVARAENSFTLIDSFIWAVPVLGFIGTAIGLSLAIGDFGAVLAGANDLSSIKTSLGAVTSGLGTAFETTLVGLFLALFLQMLASIQEDDESRFLNDCSVYCQEAIVSRLRI